MVRCCVKECFKNLWYVDVKDSRDRFSCLANVTKERNFILDYVKVHIMSDDLEEEMLQCSKIVFMIKGVQVCETVWLSSHGIAARRFSNIAKEYTEKGVQVY